MKRIIFLFSFLFLLKFAFALDPIKDFSNNALLKNANVSLMVKDLKTNAVLYELNAANSITPASTLKLVATATALEKLGPDFRFETTLEIDAEIKNNILEGNLIIRGAGDPTLGSAKIGDKEFLIKWVEAIKNKGIKRIKGSVVANTAIFDNQVVNPKWLWEDMGNYYSPGIHGLSYLDNTFRMYLSSGNAGMLTKVLRCEPEIPGMQIINQVLADNINFDNGYFYAEPFSNIRTVRGEIPANRKEFVVKGDIPDPALLLAQHFTAALIQNGIVIDGQPKTEAVDRTSKTKIYSHFSVSLIDIITETNVKSNNHYAEYLFKYLAASKNDPASNKSAIKTIRIFWNQRGLSIDQLFQNDGSGLSPSNAVSAQFFVELLSYMRTNSKYKDQFYKTLAISGVSGTLSSFLYKTPLKGKVYAKSGTIERVKSYAGYIHSDKGAYVFCIIVNNANGSSWAVQNQIEKFLVDINL
jgi:D-alanyl-D-alanine carboxypeptidase/D-alanyl-D-alanine-endopeptidase (penicillin-binding protein 4)